MYMLGIDIGSVSSKAIIIDGDKKLASYGVVSGGTGTTGPAHVLDEVFVKSGLGWGDISRAVTTGYGRINFKKADDQVSEITCRTVGVHHLLPMVRTIIDIGGQDVKAMSVSEDGIVSRFVMNDKCAAGTDRLLKVMARVLETDINKLGMLADQVDSIVEVNNTCTVFAQSEVISRLASEVKPSNLAAGIHLVARRVAGLAVKVVVKPTVVLTGGVAQNNGIVASLSNELKIPVVVALNCQITGALGAALIALKEMMIPPQRALYSSS